MPLNNSRHNLPLQRALTDLQGEYVKHYRAVVCSCQGENGRVAVPDCAVCEGTGLAYTDTFTLLRGVVAEVSKHDKQLLMAGIVMPGDMIFTPDLTVNTVIRDYDKVQLNYAIPYRGDLVNRGKDKLRYTPTAIIACERHDPLTGATTIYTTPEDFTLSGRMIVWNTGAGPAVGESYSVTYDAIVDWIVYPQTTSMRASRGTTLGQKVLLKQRHVFNINADQ